MSPCVGSVDYGRPVPQWMRYAETCALCDASSFDWSDTNLNEWVKYFPFIVSIAWNQSVVNHYHSAGVRGIIYTDFDEVSSNPPDWIRIDSSGSKEVSYYYGANSTPIYYACHHQAALRQSTLDLVNDKMKNLGVDGAYVDCARDASECYAPQYGIHTHPDTNTNTQCYEESQRQVYNLVKSYGQDKFVMQNSGIKDSHWAYSDVQLWENAIYGSTAEGVAPWGHWANLKGFADRTADAVRHGKKVAILPYFSMQPIDKCIDCALYSYAYARLYDFLWTDGFTLKNKIGEQAKDIYSLKLGPAGKLGIITGTITDSNTSVRLAGVTVKAGKVSALTDSNGKYSLALPAGMYQISASKNGYKTTVKLASTSTLDIQLQPAQDEKVYYVATDGNDSYDGTAPTYDGTHGPWKTITNGDWTQTIKPGDTVIVQPGTYNIANYTPFWISGTADKPIIYKAKGDVTIIGASGTSCPLWIWADYNIFDGFKIKQNGTGHFINLEGTGIEVRNCWLSDMAVPEHRWNGWGGILINGKDCKIHHNIIGPNNYGMTLIYLGSNSGGGNKIYNNTLDGTCKAGLPEAGDELVTWGARLESTKSSDEFRNNIIVNCYYAYGSYGATAATISNNLAFNYPPYQPPATQFFSFAQSDIVNQDPQFLEKAYGDYSLIPGSPATDKGKQVGFSFIGNSPDIGVCESSSSSDSEIKSIGQAMYRTFWNSVVVMNPQQSSTIVDIPVPAGYQFKDTGHNCILTEQNGCIHLDMEPESGRVLVAQEILSPVLKISDIQSIPDGTLIALSSKVKTLPYHAPGAVDSSGFYIEEPNRSSGIRVLGSTDADNGQMVNVTGRIADDNGERVITLTNITSIPDCYATTADGTNACQMNKVFDSLAAGDVRNLGHNCDLIWRDPIGQLGWREGINGADHLIPSNGQCYPAGAGYVIPNYPNYSICAYNAADGMYYMFGSDSIGSSLPIAGSNQDWRGLCIDDMNADGICETVYFLLDCLKWYSVPNNGGPFNYTRRTTDLNTSGLWSSFIGIATLHGNRKAALGISAADGNLLMYIMDKSQSITLPNTSSITNIVIGDIDGDGYADDIAYRDPKSQRIVWREIPVDCVEQPGSIYKLTVNGTPIAVINPNISLQPGEIIYKKLNDLSLATTAKSLYPPNLSMTGLNIRIAGKISDLNSSIGQFTLSDGAKPIKVYCPGISNPGQFAIVTGCVGSEMDSNGLTYPVIRSPGADWVKPIIQ